VFCLKRGKSRGTGEERFARRRGWVRRRRLRQFLPGENPGGVHFVFGEKTGAWSFRATAFEI